jgi:hypothetical protein
MNPEQPADKARIEARLERSLRRQVQAPRLDGRFDAAVWSRITEAGATARAPAQWRPQGTRAPRWLLFSNLVGAAVAVVLMVICAMRSVSGIEVPELDLHVALSPAERLQIINVAGAVISGLALGYGLMFTRFGRRLLAPFR